VTNHVRDTGRTRALQQLLRAGAAIGRHVPASVRQATSRPLLAALHRERRPRQPLTWDQRQRLVGYFADDIALLEELTGSDFSSWLRPR
jgi:hypothetical protein